MSIRLVHCFILFLASCAPQTQSNSVTAGETTYLEKRFVEACDFSDVVLGSPAHRREIERCEDYAQDHRDETRAFAYSEFTRALYSGQCDEVKAAPEGPLSKAAHDPVLMAGRYRQGLCLPKDPEKAHAILGEVVAEDPHDVVVMAHLGDMLWKGEGVSADKNRARTLFAAAARSALPNVVREEQLALEIKLHDPRSWWRLIPLKDIFGPSLTSISPPILRTLF